MFEESFRLIRRIGSGGMADVFLAHRRGTGGFEKPIIIKRLRARFAEKMLLRNMFVEEAKLAASVSHSNVVEVHDLGIQSDGHLYMILEWVDGLNLRELTHRLMERRLRLPVWLGVYFISEILEGLAHAHSVRDSDGRPRNIVHGDIAPDNIFLSWHGDVKLGDFGVAYDDARPESARPVGVRGKVAYMSPETTRGERPDFRADIFGCGIVLWEALTGQRLFRAATDGEAFQRIRSVVRTPPSTLNPEVPSSLDRLTLAALEPNPDNRPSSARIMQRGLQRVLRELHPLPTKHEVARFLSAFRAADVSEPIPSPEPTLSLRPPVPCGDPSNVETFDILPAAPAPIAAFESGEQPVDPVVTAAQRQLFIEQGNTRVGPLQATLVIDELLRNAGKHPTDSLRISADGERWMPVQHFERLLGEHHVDAEAPLPLVPCTGALEDGQFLGFVGQLARRAASGHLIVTSGAPIPERRVELHIDAGAMVHVASSQPLALTRELRAARTTSDEVLSQAIHVAVTRVEPLGVGFDRVHEARAEAVLRLAHRTLSNTLAWSCGRFAFEPTRQLDDEKRRLTLPLFASLFDALRGARRVVDLRRSLARIAHTRLVRSARFDREVSALSLDAETSGHLDVFVERQSLYDSLALCEHHFGEGTGVTIAYLLVELGLLVPESSAMATSLASRNRW